MQTNTSAPAEVVSLPATGFLRIKQIVGDRKANPPIPPIFPICQATWWNWVNAGRAPKPVKLSPGTTVWRVEDIRALIEKAA